MNYHKFNLMMTLSLSLNCHLADKKRQQTFMLPLAWVSMELNRWQRLAQALPVLRAQVQTAWAISGILGRSLAWGLGL